MAAYLLGQPAQSIFAFAWPFGVLGNVSFTIIFHLKEQCYRRMLVGAIAFATVPAAFGCFSLMPLLIVTLGGSLFALNAELFPATLEIIGLFG